MEKNSKLRPLRLECVLKIFFLFLASSTWISVVSLSNISKKKYISICGFVHWYEIRSINVIASFTKSSAFVITWITDYYDMFKFDLKQISKSYSTYETGKNNFNFTIIDSVEKSLVLLYQLYQSKM